MQGTAFLLGTVLLLQWPDDEGRIRINQLLDRATVMIQRQDRAPGEASVGSGFLVDDSGLIVTNHHVISGASGASGILLKFKDAPPVNSQVVAEDPDNDLALLKVARPFNATAWQPLPLGDSDEVAVGQTVLSKGNPFGLEGTLSQGIVSAIRHIQSPTGSLIRNVIQTNADVQPGNSGGPLVNLRGEAIGVISSRYLSPAGGAANINFAVPSKLVKRLLGNSSYRAWAPPSTFRLPGRVSNSGSPRIDAGGPYLGIRGQPYAGRRYRGVLITWVEPGSPAHRAGLRSERTPAFRQPAPYSTAHIIVAVDDRPVYDINDLEQELGWKRPGDSAKFTLVCCDEARLEERWVQLGSSSRYVGIPPAGGNTGSSSSTHRVVIIGGSSSSSTSGGVFVPQNKGTVIHDSTSSVRVHVPRGPGNGGRQGPVYLGIEGEDYSGDSPGNHKAGVRGVKVTRVEDHSPARIAGLRSDRDSSPAGASCQAPGHVIVAVDGEPVRNLDDLARILQAMSPGQVADFSVLSCDKEDIVPVKLGHPQALGGLP
ncbi:MAG: trypsin-like peptidase domain-containing protein [Acidobacteria bacterium]|nr:trypsin-like peptidase domain-containing protein [Acidobacteriota bacterium]